MAETPSTEPPKANNGLGGLLTSLVKGGDRQVQLLIVGIIGFNTIMTTCNKQSINDNSKNIAGNSWEIEQTRKKVIDQIRTMYNNQHIWGTYAQESLEEHRLIMEKLGIPKEQWPRMRPLRFEEPDNEQEEP